jgi:hypothetical protein
LSQEFPKHHVNDSVFDPKKHKPADELQLGTLAKGRGASLTRWRAAGPQSNDRAIAAMWLLRITAPDNFDGIQQAWMGSLLGRVGLCYRERSSGKNYTSLGFKEHCVCLWEVRHVSGDMWSLGGVPDNPSFAAVFDCSDDSSQYVGVPYKVCCPAECPQECCGNGVLLQLGATMPLVKFAIKSGVPLRADDLKKLCHVRGVKPEANAEGKTNKPEFLAALVKSVIDPDEVDQVLSRYEKSDDAKRGPDPALGKALRTLDPEVAREFSDLQDQEDRAEAQIKIDEALAKDPGWLLDACTAGRNF